ncbi:uncharacterized protein LOC112182868 [Rosa chinensis]|uniref:uncharacterized protein LOC112182868 n=1 Tax=Rosa chinensis TaxID=74649 RepID=UPI000D089DF7|nr:uncharacterized protein LOC112182868 [Rosa chinensis]
MTTTQTSSTLPHFTRPRKFEVFLSFRGLDTRKGFTDHLYKALFLNGIHTFRDDEQLESGKPISLELTKAIRESEISVIILSKNYATSTWCLDELAEMVERMDEPGGLIILPVFYDVTPSQVREQTGDSFEEAFAQHEHNFVGDTGKVTRWRKSLIQVAGLSGYDLRNFRHETEVIQRIVERIFGALNYTNHIFSNDLKDFVGIDRVKEIELNLCMESEEICVVGICGMPGIGKTTVAQALFVRIRNQFEAFSFISKVGEISRSESLFHIQEQLCDDLLNRKVNIKNVNEVISRRLRGKRVLIVLDNVDELEQIESVAGSGDNLYDRFGPGSRIIITTRDERLLINYEPKIYKVEKLTEDEALLLFCRKAFKKDHPLDGFAELAYKFVDYIDGLPLALVVLGSSLFKRSVKEWSSKLNRLKDYNYSGERKIIDILKVSFDGLENQAEKEIFLDTACFFKGEDACRVEKIFESCGYYPDISINILLERYLVSIIGGKLWMHDLLQEMGREIVRGESQKPGKRSRLWLHTDALPLLRNNKGTDAVKGIFLCSPQQDNVHLKADPFANMESLRMLKIYNVIFSGCLEFLSNELSFLEWHGYPLKSLPSCFEPDKLVELNLYQSEIEQLWEEIERPLEKLVIINLTDCEYLIKTPDFDKVPKLERLILKGCTRLSEVDLSVGVLQRLILLNLEGCECLTTLLPNSINLRSLTKFILSGCSKLKNLPEFGEEMKQLRELHLNGTAIEELPTSMKHLTGLTLLNLKECKNLLCLPEVICTALTSLQILNLSGCSNLALLPESLVCLEYLEELHAGGSAIPQFPSSILHLKNLQVLSFAGCKGLPSSVGFELPASFSSGLCSLKKLNLRNCNLCEGSIPDDLGSVSSLQYLDLSGNNFMTIPKSISQLSQLEDLVLDNCSNLQSLPRLPSSIRVVTAQNCPLLQGTHSNKLTVWTSTAAGFSVINCQSGEAKPQWIDLPDPHLRRPFCQTFFEGAIYRGSNFEYSYISKDTPAWLSRRSTGSSITIPLPPDLDDNCTWMGFALCFTCVTQHHDSLDTTYVFLDDQTQINLNRNFRIHFYTTEDPLERPLVHNYPDCDWVGSFMHWNYTPRSDFVEISNKRFIRATIVPGSPEVEVTGCAASLIYLEEVAEFVQKMNIHHDNCNKGYRYLVDAMGSIPSTSRIQTKPEVQKQETNSTSARLVGQLRRNVVSLVEELFEGGNPRRYDYGFILPLGEKLAWFSEQGTGCVVSSPLPPELHNDENWVGFALYVVCTLPPGVSLSHRLSFFECQFHTSNEAVGPNQLIHRLVLRSPFDDNLMGSNRLLLIHVPRARFPERLNRCRCIQALFGSTTLGVQVDICGMHLVYDQDLNGLVQTIAHCAVTSQPVYYGIGDLTVATKLGNNAGMTAMITNLLEAAKSSEGRSLRQVRLPVALGPVDSGETTLTFRGSIFFPADGSQHERERRPVHGDETSAIGDFKFQLPDFGPSFDRFNNMRLDNQILGFDRYLKYNSCFPPNEIAEWFGHPSSGSSVTISLPSYLYDDPNWTGLALCAYFSVLNHTTTDLDNLDQEISHNLTCLLETDRGCLESLHGYCTTNQEFEWLYHMGGFIWLSYIPRWWFLDQLNERSHLEASIGSDRGSLCVHRCGLRLLYLQDEEGFKQTIMHYITSLSDIDQGKKKQFQDCKVGSSPRTGSYIDFDRYSVHNFCFPATVALEWFGHQSNGSSVTVPLPPNLHSDANWIGLTLCASFSVVEHPTADLEKLHSGNPHHLICHLESERGSIEPLHNYCTTNEEFQWLHFGGFIWVSYIPRDWFLDQLNECSVLETSIASDHESFRVHNCEVRCVYQHDMEEFKQSILHCMTSLPGNKGDDKQCPAGDAGSSSIPSSFVVEPHLERLEWLNYKKGHFDRHSIFNFCFPSSINLEWLGDQRSGSTVTIPLPPNLNRDSDWIGLAVCSYFSVMEHPIDDLDTLDIQAISHHLICHLESERGSLESLHDYCTTNEEFMWLHLGGFIWLSYIPRAWFSDHLNECGVLTASIASDHKVFSVHMCGLHLMHQRDEEEFKQTLVHYMALSSDNKGKNKQYHHGETESSSKIDNSIEELPHIERVLNDVKGKRILE